DMTQNSCRRTQTRNIIAHFMEIIHKGRAVGEQGSAHPGEGRRGPRFGGVSDWPEADLGEQALLVWVELGPAGVSALAGSRGAAIAVRTFAAVCMKMMAAGRQ
ncbi:hypothetical protein, partial [Kitasatospora sp. NPDC001225]